MIHTTVIIQYTVKMKEHQKCIYLKYKLIIKTKIQIYIKYVLKTDIHAFIYV